MPERIPYAPPEFDLAGRPVVPFAEVGLTIVEPGMTVSGVGAFVDLDPIERQVYTSMYLRETPRTEQGRQLAYKYAELTRGRLGAPLGSLLRPKAFGGSLRLVDTPISLLPYDPERTAAYIPQAGQRLVIREAVTLYMAGRLRSRDENSPPFRQEVSYIYTTRHGFYRFIGPRAELQAAAQAVTQTRKRSQQVGELTDVRIEGSTLHPDPRRHPLRGDDPAP